MAEVALTNYTFYKNGESGVSAVVGIQTWGHRRVARYNLQVPATGANAVSFRFSGNEMGEGEMPGIRFYIGTDPNSHATADTSYAYTGELTVESEGYRSVVFAARADIILLPNTTYYVWVFPVTTELGWLHWGAGLIADHAVATLSGAAASAFTCDNGTLGTPLALNVVKYATNHTHTITFVCGTASGSIATKVSETALSWTPPLSLANQNTNDVSVLVTIKLQTYSGNTAIGEPVSKTVTMAIPDSIKPSCTINVADAEGFADTYGAYVKGLSKLNVDVVTTMAYGAAISSYRSTANGSTYTDVSFITDVLKTCGTLYVKAKVTDTRTRTSDEASESITVLDYIAPTISALTASRCNADGTVNKVGGYVKVKFSAAVTALNNKNSAKYVLKYKKASAVSYTSVSLDALEDIYTATNETYIFPADTASSYVVELTLEDNHLTAARATAASTASVVMHPHPSGNGLAVLKMAEKAGYFEVGGPAYFYSGVEGITHDMVGAAPIKKAILAQPATAGWYRVGIVNAYNCYRIIISTIWATKADVAAIIDVCATFLNPVLTKASSAFSQSTTKVVDQVRLIKNPDKNSQYFVDIHWKFDAVQSCYVLIDGPQGWFTPWAEWTSLGEDGATAAVTLAM